MKIFFEAGALPLNKLLEYQKGHKRGQQMAKRSGEDAKHPLWWKGETESWKLGYQNSVNSILKQGYNRENRQ